MNNDLIESTELLFKMALETMKKKNADYGGGEVSSMRNFELSADIAGISMSKGILVRLMDKMTRIGNLMDKEAQVENETIFDTIQDGINYLAILLHALRIEGKGISKGEIEVGDATTMKYTPGIRDENIPSPRRSPLIPQ